MPNNKLSRNVYLENIHCVGFVKYTFADRLPCKDMVKMIGCLIVPLIFSQTLSVVSLRRSYLNEGSFFVFIVKDLFSKVEVQCRNL